MVSRYDERGSAKAAWNALTATHLILRATMTGAPASATPPKWRWLRIIPLAAAVGSLVTGLWVGIARLGLVVPSGAHTLAEFHGALMISGFLGTLISLERSVAIGRWWAYTAPALSATGAAALIVERPALASYSFLFAGSF